MGDRKRKVYEYGGYTVKGPKCVLRCSSVRVLLSGIAE
jgi:hypothetical protein